MQLEIFILVVTLTTGYSTIYKSNGTPVQIKSATNFVASDLFRFRAEDNNNDLIYEGKEGTKCSS